MSSKFFTNEPENDLYSRFAAILKDNTQFMEILVGYFRTSGFYRMYKALASVEKIRILVGLNVDRQTVQFIDQANLELKTEKQAKDDFAQVVENEFAEEEMTKEKEIGVRTFVEWLKSGKMELRIYHEQPIHAKVYIMRRGGCSSDFGKVITGSSNFSISGLQNNLEFNVELREDDDVKFAMDKFEELWVKGVPITNEYITVVKDRTWLKEDITPYQIFLKAVYEFFEEEINNDLVLQRENLTPDNFQDFKYQRDAVTQARKILNAYNGVFIADVVGLGKTFICAKLARTLLNQRILVICPPVLVKYWQEVMYDFGVAAKVVSLGKLDRITEEELKGIHCVFVDEAHRFRNAKTESFTLLHQICYNKKVVLISATPMNNYSRDIANQIYLFQDRHNSDIAGVPDLEKFFAELAAKEDKYMRGTKEHARQLAENSQVIRDRVLRHLMVRRTRSEVMKYYKEDMERLGLSFPKVGDPIAVAYEFNAKIDEIFTKTIQVISKFTYARYKPLTYLLNPNAEQRKGMAAQENMMGFMRGILVKRLESSFYAFKLTLGRFRESYGKFIDMFKAGDVYISKKVDVYDLLDKDLEKLVRSVDEDRTAYFKAEEFKEEFLQDLQQDLSNLDYLHNLWQEIGEDPKLEKFKEELQDNEKFRGNKKLIFTESRETAEYLERELQKVYGKKVVAFSGESSLALKEKIERSFNPAKYDPEHDDYEILITTDVLAEGVNLHNANVVLNYDLPWNPTRIMQRVGRINRVGTKFEEIFIFNFFPTAQSSTQISLTARIKDKLQMFHQMLGDDFKYLTEDEETTPQQLFDALQANPDKEEDENPELYYLHLIRHIRDENEALFVLIKNLPKKARSARRYGGIKGTGTLSFIKKGGLKPFYLTEKGATKRLEFREAIKYLECEPEERQEKLAEEYYTQYAWNSNAFDAELEGEMGKLLEKRKNAANEVKIMKLLKILRGQAVMTETDVARVDALLEAWEEGRIPPNVSKNIAKFMGKSNDLMAVYSFIRENVDEIYLQKRIKRRPKEGKKEVILSCYLKGGN